jgi:hypothetical protein
MSGKLRRISTSRRAALAGGAALVLGAAAAHTVGAQQAADGVAAQQAADQIAVGVNLDTAAGPGNEDVLFYSSGTPVDIGKRRTDWLKAVAGKLGVTPDRVDTAMQDAAKEVGFPMPLVAPFPPSMPPGAFSLHIEAPFAAAAKAIGITEDQLRKEQTGGKSLADVAKAHNVDPKTVGEAIKTQRRADLDKAVADGSLPKAAADRIKSHLDSEIDHLLQVGAIGGQGLFTIHLEQSGLKEP